MASIAVAPHRPVDRAEHGDDGTLALPDDLTPLEHELLGDLFAIVSEHADEVHDQVDRSAVLRAFLFACEHHADQRRQSGEDFITHPVGVAKICAGMRLDTETLCAALLHDTVEDTTASLDEVREEFGDEVAGLVDGVTKLTGITFQSRDEAQAENYRKMMVAMATDIRVILIKLADRLHNMRTLGAMPKQKQIEKAKETLEIYAPLAHRLGIHAIKWELEDLAFATLHPRKYQEIKGLVNQQREERERYVSKAGGYLAKELEALGIHSEISGRAKHFYSIYSKMTRKGREFNEIYDLTAMRVIVDSVKDCYGAVGVIHSLWKPLPGRFKDMVAMPKFNMYQALHTTVIGPEGRPLEIQIRTGDMHVTAEYGVAAHWRYKENATQARLDPTDQKLKWLKSLLDLQADPEDPTEFTDHLRGELIEDEVFVFTPKGEVKSLAVRRDAAGLRVRDPHRRRPPLRRRARERQDRPAALRAAVGRHRRDPHVQARARPVARLAGAGEDDPRAQQDQGLVQGREPRRLRAHRPRAAAGAPEQGRAAGPEADRLAAAGRRDPRARLQEGRRLLHRARRREDLAQGRRQQGHAAAQAGRGRRRGAEPGEDLLLERRKAPALRRPDGNAAKFGIRVEGVSDVPLRLAKCCRPVSGDPIVGYVSLGRGITIHRDDCPNVAALRKDPERFVPVSWDGDNEIGFRVEIQVDAWDRHRLLEDLSRTFAEAGINIVEARCLVQHPMTRNRFVIEVGDTQALKSAINRLRAIDSVFDAYRVIPAGG